MLELRRLLALLSLAGVLLAAGHARAFCRTKACDTNPSYGDIWDEGPEPTECVRNAQGCYLEGTPLFWRSHCVTFGVQQDGSRASEIDVDAARAVIQEAFDKWAAADCGGGATPSFRWVDQGNIVCDRAEYDQDGPNQNVILFRDSEWPYRGAIDALALTTLTYNVETAEIYDADIELNAVDATFTITDEPTLISADLSSVVTHEVGHFLGLSHSSDSGAVMRGTGYQPGTTELRILTGDDIQGVCTIFPPDAPMSGACETRHGFSTECGSSSPNEKKKGCSLGAPDAGGHGIGAVATLFGALLALRRKRTKRR